jgi:branched-chain amino acid transport system ATP-binding protein
VILEVNDIHTFYGTSHVLFGISLGIEEGEVVCLLGRNGAGKTTTLRSIIGLTPPRTGDITFRGESIVNKPTYYISRKGIGWVPDDRRIFPDLAIRRNLLLAAHRGKNGGYWTLDTIYELFPKLQELDSRMGGYLSGGEQQMLAIARTLMTNPRLLLLDEPGEGLAPLIIKALGESLMKLKELNVTITKRGVVIYNNYRKNKFNVLLLTIHSGTWVPESLKDKLLIKDIDRTKEEDIDTHRIYSKLVLEKGGIWIDNKQSRFVIDFNRTIEGAIYDTYNVEKGISENVWAKELTKREYSDIFTSYREFYFTLARLLDAFQFNIIFDGHSMKDLQGRPSISFGTRYIPVFYTPIVKSMQRKISSLGYKPVMLNAPYGGGFILKWLSTKFPNAFVFSMEVNKRLYMTKDRLKTIEKNLEQISSDIVQIFDIEPPEPAFVKAPERKDKATRAAKSIPQ